MIDSHVLCLLSYQSIFFPQHLAGRVGLEPTYNSLTGSPPTDGAPAKSGATATTRTFTSRASTGRSARYSYRRKVFAHRGLPGPASPHRHPDRTAVPLDSPLRGQAVMNSHTTGPGPNPVLPHRQTTPGVRTQTGADGTGSNPQPPAYKAGTLAT